MGLSYIVDCEVCAKEVRQTREPATKFLRQKDGRSEVLTCCANCEPKIDEANKPFTDAEAELDAIAKAAMDEKLQVIEDAKKSKEDKATSDISMLAKSIELLAQQNQAILKLLTPVLTKNARHK